MKRRLIYIILTAAIAVSCSGTGLEKAGWKKQNYKALNALIKDHGTRSDGYDPKVRPYAVFDFDNTTVTGDISMSLAAYQIENLRFGLDPESVYDIFIGGIPNIDSALDGFPSVSVRSLAIDIHNDYAWLYRNYIRYARAGQEAPASLEEIHESQEYLDLRAKIWSLTAGIVNTFGYDVGSLWIIKLFSGMPVSELQDLAREAAASEMKLRKPKTETWTSPDMGEAGQVSVDVPRGLGIRKELVNLYSTLTRNGFDVYVCSSSAEMVVEAVACDGTMGLDLDPTQVFGIRINGGDFVSSSPSYVQGYPRTHHEGKSELIRNILMPDHGGRGPVLVAGDSNGDCSMLVDFDDMELGLIIDQPRSGEIQDLKSDRSGRYAVQKW